MSSRWGLTPDEALARIIETERIIDEKERREEYRKILEKVRYLGWSDGYDEGRADGEY